MPINIHEAKTHFSRLVDAAVAGDEVIIARAGRPVAKLVAIDAPEKPSRLGFLAAEGRIPDDFDEIGRDEIAALFSAAEA